MRPIISNESNIVAYKVTFRAVVVVVPLIVALAIANLFVESVLWSGVIAAAISIAPLLAMIWTQERLPDAVEQFVSDKLPEHIEYVSTDRLRAELLCREKAVIVCNDTRRKHIMVFDNYSDQLDQKELQRLFGTVEVWCKETIKQARARGVEI